MQWCILCGKQLNQLDDRRYKQLGQLSGLLLERCHSTPFVFRYIQEQGRCAGTVRCPCCIACINWIRRLNIPYFLRRRRAKKVPIPLDNLLLFLHCPGAAIVRPDQRSFVRLIRNLVMQQTNPHARFLTPLMDRALKKLVISNGKKGNKFLVDQLVLAWWENSGKPVILPDRITARYMRRALRHAV